jgi:hypothetical protein
MSDAIGPGDWVECVDNGPLRSYLGFMRSAPELSPGTLYRVSHITRLGGIVLSQLPSPTEGGGYNPDRFRPIRSDITEIERLLTEPVQIVDPLNVFG